MGSRAMYPGTFDPFTNGHNDLVRRASRIFDRVVVAIAANPGKAPLFSVEERVDLARRVLADIPGVEVQSYAGLTVDFARQHDIAVIVRGLRAVSDFEYEFQMALMNRRLNPRVETLFMMPKEEYSYLSSRLAKEAFSLGGNISGLVPKSVLERLHQKMPHRGGA